MELAGRTAIVTGGARRIGRAFSEALAREGMNVAVHYRSSREEAEAVVQAIKSGGGSAVAIEHDLEDAKNAGVIVDRACDAFGAVHLLVNNASIFFPESFAETSFESLRRHQAVHSDAPFVLAQRLAEQLPEGESGQIVQLLDWRATKPDPAYMAYGLSKHALHAQTLLLARALAPRIRVNAISPGAILPPEHGDAGENAQKHEEIGRDTPLARTGSPEDLVRALLFLVRDADYTTGLVVPVDGGRHLQ